MLSLVQCPIGRRVDFSDAPGLMSDEQGTQVPIYEFEWQGLRRDF